MLPHGLARIPDSPTEARPGARRVHVLDPAERSAEILFGLVMVLGFTGSISAAESSREDVRVLLYGALGCNVAWGIVDGAMYLMACLAERGAAWRLGRAFREAKDADGMRAAVASSLPESVAAALTADDLETLRRSLWTRLEDPPRPRLGADDWRGALAVFLLVTLTTLPVALPFVFLHDAQVALRVSNGVAIAMLFGLGVFFGRAASLRPLRTGAAMVALGLVLVGLTIALGG